MFKKLLVLTVFSMIFNVAAMAPSTPPRNPNADQQAPNIYQERAAARQTARNNQAPNDLTVRLEALNLDNDAHNNQAQPYQAQQP